MTEYIIAGSVILTLLIAYLVYINWGMKGKLRRYVKKHNLKTKSKDLSVSVEFLRQNFLIEYPQYRDKEPEYFIKHCTLLYDKPNDEFFEDGSFYVNEHSDLLQPLCVSKINIPPIDDDCMVI